MTRRTAALPFFEAEAKQRQIESGKEIGRGCERCGPIGPHLKHRARDDAAQAFNTSPRNVQRRA